MQTSTLPGKHLTWILTLNIKSLLLYFFSDNIFHLPQFSMQIHRIVVPGKGTNLGLKLVIGAGQLIIIMNMNYMLSMRVIWQKLVYWFVLTSFTSKVLKFTLTFDHMTKMNSITPFLPLFIMKSQKQALLCRFVSLNKWVDLNKK